MTASFSSAAARRIARASIAASLAALTFGASAQASLTPIKVSYQVSYWALPFFIAQDKGWWAEAGLKPEFVAYPAGAQQIAGAPSKSWDVGSTGSPPAVLGAQRYEIMTIGISNDESATNAVMARKDKIAAIKANPAKELKGQQVLLSPNSTGEYATMACLKKWGMQRSDVQIVPLAPAQLVSAYTGDNGMLAGTWAPNTYTLKRADRRRGDLQRQGRRRDGAGRAHHPQGFRAAEPGAGGALPLRLPARGELREGQPRADAIAALRKFYEANGIKLKDAYLANELERPIFPLDEQLKMMSRTGGKSTADGAFDALAGYLKSVGTIADVPDPKVYITDDYMKMVDKNATLKAFANKTN